MQGALAPPTVSVNVSTAQLEWDGFVDSLAAILDRYHLPAAALELEITETLMARDPDGALRVLTALKGLGVGLALGRFSAPAIPRSPTSSPSRRTCSKIDQGFITNLAEDPKDRAVVNAGNGAGPRPSACPWSPKG